MELIHTCWNKYSAICKDTIVMAVDHAIHFSCGLYLNSSSFLLHKDLDYIKVQILLEG